MPGCRKSIHLVSREVKWSSRSIESRGDLQQEVSFSFTPSVKQATWTQKTTMSKGKTRLRNQSQKELKRRDTVTYDPG